MQRYICIHGHYYQPPRENPWLEAIEQQDSAYPYHDWNERITAECYAPNGASRVLDADGRIEKISNNYARTSFNFGPTLMAWLESQAAATYRSVIAADEESRERFGGHGSAMAQCYNHMIMPLANRRDKYTQIRWGIRDFERRFGRFPEGMWLPETAVDIETLEILAEQGIKFTVLAPNQASRVRRMTGRGGWRDVSSQRIDPTRAYQQRLPSGRRISLYFYDGPISQGVAFEGLLRSGEVFADRLATGFDDERTWPELVHIATDGETYGHHHRHGEMALAYALDYIESSGIAKLTNYGEYLELHRPDHQVEIFEDSSWSCVHGVERWRSACGCNTGGHGDWNQEWRRPLREALDWLRDTLAPMYEDRAQEYFQDPWKARDDYIEVILDRSRENVDRFLSRHDSHPLADEERTAALKLLELQRHAMLMFTSCGWFFDELSGIETVQVIQYAGRVIQLAQEMFGFDAETEFRDRLAGAKSNLPEHGDGARIYDKWVKPAAIDLKKVGAHYAVSSLFEPYSDEDRIYCYDVSREAYQASEAGKTRTAVGRARVTSVITGESSLLTFGVLHFGDHNLTGGVREYISGEAYNEMVSEVMDSFSRADLPEVLRLLDRHFSGLTYSLKSLFRDEQRKILRLIMEPILQEAESLYRDFYERHATLMRALTDLGVPLPRRLHAAAEMALDTALRSALQSSELDQGRIEALFEEARLAGITVDQAGLAFTLQLTVERLADEFARDAEDTEGLKRLLAAAEVTRRLPFEVNLWEPQNVYWGLLQNVYPQMAARLRSGDGAIEEWVRCFELLGDRLDVRVRMPVAG